MRSRSVAEYRVSDKKARGGWNGMKGLIRCQLGRGTGGAVPKQTRLYVPPSAAASDVPWGPPYPSLSWPTESRAMR